MKRIVVALGGNAILQAGQEGTFEEQMANVEVACEQLAGIAEMGYQLAIVHGNGPQVGNLLRQNELAAAEVPAMPLFLLGAESQGMLGYMIQRGMQKALSRRGLEKPVTTVVTQVLVDPADPAFQSPTKPIGSFYDEAYAKAAMAEKGESWVEDSGRGWRRVVPSPKPVEIVERAAVSTLLDSGAIVISAGGGGVPTVMKDGCLEGIDAVLDKDLVAECLAAELGAEMLMILTDVPNIMIRYRQPDQQALGEVDLAQLRQYCDEGHFAKGSMLPKVTACMAFVEKTARKAVITALDNAVPALAGGSGSVVVP